MLDQVSSPVVLVTFGFFIIYFMLVIKLLIVLIKKIKIVFTCLAKFVKLLIYFIELYWSRVRI